MKIHSERIQSYLFVITLLLKDILKEYKLKLVFVTLAAAGAMVSQLSGFIFSVRYISGIQNGRDFSLGPLILPVHSSSSVLIIGTILVTLFTLAVSLTYYTRTSATSLSLKYEERCLNRLASKLANIITPLDRIYDEKYITKLINVDVKACGISLKILLGGMLPLFIFVTTMSIALYIDPSATIVILTFFIVALPFLYFNSVTGLRVIKDMEKTSSEASAFRSKLNKTILSLKMPYSSEDTLSLVKGNEAIANHNKLFSKRLISIEKSRVLTQAFIAFALCSFIIYAGLSISIQRLTFTHLFIYFLALRYGGANLIAISTMLTNFNFQLPQLRRYFMFMHDVEKKYGKYKMENRGEIISKAINYDVKTVQKIKIMFPIAIITPNSITRLSISNILSMLNIKLTFGLLSSDMVSLEGTPFKRYFNLPDAYYTEELLIDLQKWHAPEDIFHAIEKSKNNDIEECLRIIVSFGDSGILFLNILSTIYKDSDILVVERKTMDQLNDKTSEKIKNEFFNKKLMIYAHDIEPGKYIILDNNESTLFWEEDNEIFFLKREDYLKYKKELKEKVKNFRKEPVKLDDKNEEDYEIINGGLL